MLWILIILLLLMIVVYFYIPGGKLWKQYVREADCSVTKSRLHAKQCVFSEDEVAKLPQLLRTHIRKGGYMGTMQMDHMNMKFHNTRFRMSVNKEMIPITYEQVNCVAIPDRHAFLSGRMVGIPFQAKDSVRNGQGSMSAVLAKQFQLFHSTGSHMDQSQLITALADGVFMPSLFLQEFISWRILDTHCVEGEITWNGVKAKGRFRFDEGRIIRFDTDDRYMDENGKGSSLTPWYVTYDDYKLQNGFVQPSCVTVNWQLLNCVDTYFICNQIEIAYPET